VRALDPSRNLLRTFYEPSRLPAKGARSTDASDDLSSTTSALAAAPDDADGGGGGEAGGELAAAAEPGGGGGGGLFSEEVRLAGAKRERVVSKEQRFEEFKRRQRLHPEITGARTGRLPLGALRHFLGTRSAPSCRRVRRPVPRARARYAPLPGAVPTQRGCAGLLGSVFEASRRRGL